VCENSLLSFPCVGVTSLYIYKSNCHFTWQCIVLSCVLVNACYWWTHEWKYYLSLLHDL